MKDLNKVLDLIIEDIKQDVHSMEGKPFTGKTVAEYYGYQAAAISAIANVIKHILKEKQDGEHRDNNN